MENKIVKGKIVHKEGKYFLDVAGEMQALPTGVFTDPNYLKEQVGKEIEVVYSIPKSFPVAILGTGTYRPKGPIGTCNIPAWELLRNETFVTQPSMAVTRNVATSLLKEGLITQEVHDTIINSYSG